MTVDIKPWVVSIAPIACPADLTGIPDDYIQAWERYVGPVTPGDGDREDWIETCARLCWGVRDLGDDAIVRVHGKWDGDNGALIGLPHFGPVMKVKTCDQVREASTANRYMVNPTVRQLMHRRALLSSVHGDDIRDTFGRLVGQGAASFVVKYAAREKGLPILRLEGDDPALLERQVREWGGWEFVHAEDDPNALLIQQRVDMQYEYRMFMVGDRPACGAGCVELNTPLDNMGARFDPQMQKRRNGRSKADVEVVPELTERYRRFAVRAGRLFRHCGYGAYVLDLCLIDGEVSVVELNGMMNAGLYALDMGALTRAMRADRQQFVPIALDGDMLTACLTDAQGVFDDSGL